MRTKVLGAAAGIATPILAFSCILGAIASYPAFNWTHNALSDLGVVSGATGPLFNFGLYASGFLGLIFAVLGLYPYVGKNFVGKAGSVLFSAATVALILIGVFNESFGETHYAVSVAFFVLAPIALFVLTLAFFVAPQRRDAVFTVTVAVVAVVPWILLYTIHYVPNMAIPETISALAVSAWTILVSCEILKQMKK